MRAWVVLIGLFAKKIMTYILVYGRNLRRTWSFWNLVGEVLAITACLCGLQMYQVCSKVTLFLQDPVFTACRSSLLQP